MGDYCSPPVSIDRLPQASIGHVRVSGGLAFLSRKSVTNHKRHWGVVHAWVGQIVLFVTKVRRKASVPLRRELDTTMTAGAAMAALG